MSVEVRPIRSQGQKEPVDDGALKIGRPNSSSRTAGGSRPMASVHTTLSGSGRKGRRKKGVGRRHIHWSSPCAPRRSAKLIIISRVRVIYSVVCCHFCSYVIIGATPNHPERKEADALSERNVVGGFFFFFFFFNPLDRARMCEQQEGCEAGRRRPGLE